MQTARVMPDRKPLDRRSGRVVGLLVIIMAVALGAVSYQLIQMQQPASELSDLAPAGTFAVVLVDMASILQEQQVKQFMAESEEQMPAAFKKLDSVAVFVMPGAGGSTDEPRVAGIARFVGTTQEELNELLKNSPRQGPQDSIVADAETLLFGRTAAELQAVRAVYAGEASGGLSSELRSMVKRSGPGVLVVSAVIPEEAREKMAQAAPGVPVSAKGLSGFGLNISSSKSELSLRAVARFTEESEAEELGDALKKTVGQLKQGVAQMPENADGTMRLQRDLASNTDASVSGRDIIVKTSVSKDALGEAGKQMWAQFGGQMVSQLGRMVPEGGPATVQQDPTVTAHKAAARARLMQIGAGMRQLYASTGGWPEDLSALAEEGIMPSGSLALEFDKSPLKVNGTRTSFRYAGTPLPIDLPPQAAVAYTRAGLLPAGRMVLYSDGAALWAPGARFVNPREDMSNREVYEHIVEALGDDLTEDRKAELRDFYDLPAEEPNAGE